MRRTTLPGLMRLLGGLVILGTTATPALAVLGDCNGDRVVTVDELVTGVNIALDTTPLANCPFFDVNDDGKVTVEELVGAVSIALNGAPIHVPGQYEGFGKTKGGLGKTSRVVTSCANSGAGTLREAVTNSNSYITFNCPGPPANVINLTSAIEITGSNITISGWESPTTGVSVNGRPLIVKTTARDVVITNVRLRNSTDDGIRVESGAQRVTIDHVSATGAGDENLSVVNTGSRDVTISWSLAAAPPTNKNMLLGDLATHISVHHTAFINSANRNPLASYAAFVPPPAPSTDPNLTLDLVSNLVWGWGSGDGAKARLGTKANVVNNYFNPNGADNMDSLVVENTDITQVYASGNVNPNLAPGVIDNKRTTSTRFAAPPVSQPPANQAACQILSLAGARQLSGGTWVLDATDQSFRNQVTGISCP